MSFVRKFDCIHNVLYYNKYYTILFIQFRDDYGCFIGCRRLMDQSMLPLLLIITKILYLNQDHACYISLDECYDFLTCLMM